MLPLIFVIPSTSSPDVVDVGGQRVGVSQVKRSEIKNTASYLIPTLNIEIALVETRSKLVKKYDKIKKNNQNC